MNDVRKYFKILYIVYVSSFYDKRFVNFSSSVEIPPIIVSKAFKTR